MSDDQPEIIARPPSHPIATTLLIIAAIGTSLAIALVWAELFGEYMPTQGPETPQWKLKEHAPKGYAEKGGPHDYYEKDYGKGDILQGVETDLGVSSSIGDLSGAPAGGGDAGSSDG